MSTALEFYRAANGHVQVLQLVEPHVSVKETGTDAIMLGFYNVMGFAVELCLKSFLAAKGASPDEIWGHNIVKLFETAKRHGLEYERDRLGQIVQHVAQNHKSYTYRYPDEAKSPTIGFIKEQSFAVMILARFVNYLHKLVMDEVKD